MKSTPLHLALIGDYNPDVIAHQAIPVALQQAAEVLDANFNRDNPDSRALRARVGELVERPIEVKAPELSDSLNAVQAYIEHKQSARERLKDAPGEDSVEERP